MTIAANSLSVDTSGTTIPTMTSSQLSQGDATQQLVNSSNDFGTTASNGDFTALLGQLDATYKEATKEREEEDILKTRDSTNMNIWDGKLS